MATIEFGTSQNPYAYGDRGRADFDSRWHDNLTVYVDARVENSGNASGQVQLKLYDLSRGGPNEGAGAIQADQQTVGAMQGDVGTPTPAILRVEQLMARDAYVDFVAEVTDRDGNVLASRQFSVNAYNQPQVAELSVSGAINVRVS
jgi:hypothetical protein